MKKLILLTTAVTSLQAQCYKYLGEYTYNGAPLYLKNPANILFNKTSGND